MAIFGLENGAKTFVSQSGFKSFGLVKGGTFGQWWAAFISAFWPCFGDGLAANKPTGPQKGPLLVSYPHFHFSTLVHFGVGVVANKLEWERV